MVTYLVPATGAVFGMGRGVVIDDVVDAAVRTAKAGVAVCSAFFLAIVGLDGDLVSVQGAAALPALAGMAAFWPGIAFRAVGGLAAVDLVADELAACASGLFAA